jgi:hypothetical protein
MRTRSEADGEALGGTAGGSGQSAPRWVTRGSERETGSSTRGPAATHEPQHERSARPRDPRRWSRPGPHDMPEPLIDGNLPLNGEAPVRHAAESGVGQGVKCQPSPQHDGVTPGIPRGDPKSEGIDGQRLMSSPRHGSPSGTRGAARLPTASAPAPLSNTERRETDEDKRISLIG